MLPHNSTSRRTRTTIWNLALLCAAFTVSNYLPAQNAEPANPHPPAAEKKGREYTINVDVNLVVLHATVLDKKGHFANDQIGRASCRERVFITV